MSTQRPFTQSRLALLRELVSDATLAASSHNSQPWRFRCDSDSIAISPDWSRRCPIVDPDDRHLFTSLGCATENLVQAAAARGVRSEAHWDTETRSVCVRIGEEAPTNSELSSAIPERQCSRTDYEPREVPSEDLLQLEKVAQSGDVSVLLLTERSKLRAIAEFVRQGNNAQFGDRKWVDELRTWMRFTEHEARERGDGLSVKSVGAPAVPRWLADKLFHHVVKARSQNTIDIPRIERSSGVAVFLWNASNPFPWIELGRSYERFALLATKLHIKNAFINQPVEVRSLLPQLSSWLNLKTEQPALLVRFGYGKSMPRSHRRRLEDVLDD